MANLTPGDVHVLRPVGTDPRTFYARRGDNEWTNRKKQRKRKVPQPDYTPTGVNKMNELVQKKFHSASNRRKLAASGNALPDGSYPIGDAEDLKNAATLARSGHGNVSGARRLIARRAKQLGVSNPLATAGSVDKSVGGLLVELSSHFSRLTE